jgi:hypothetical protein
MNAEEDYGFDVSCFLHLSQVLTPAQVKACTDAIDTVGRKDDMLAWPAPHCDPFLELRQHPMLCEYLESLCGADFALDQVPSLIADGPEADARLPLQGDDPEHNRRLRYVNFQNTRTSHGVRDVPEQALRQNNWVWPEDMNAN